MQHSPEQSLTASPVLPGEIVAGRYRVERVIGRGGTGVVVLARHLAQGNLVALKFLRRDTMADKLAVHRFVREARASALLSSPHVARVIEAETIDAERAFIAMEYLEGCDLSEVLEREGRLAIEIAVQYVLQACHAIAEAHALGIVHRDIKPSNLFLTRDRAGCAIVKVLDFGLSKVAWAGATVTSINRVLGTPHFMSPEQMRASRDVDIRSDIWSLGAVLYALISGQCPFRGKFLMDVCAAVLSGESIPLRQLRSEVCVELESVVMRCLSLEPEDRFQSVSQLVAALLPFFRR